MSLVGRHTTIERALAELEAGRSVVAIGARGLGRTAFLDAVAQRLDDARLPVVCIAGSDGESGVALAPFAGLLARQGLAAIPPLEIYARVPRELAASATRVIVDDLDVLDPASRILLDHLRREGVAVLASAPALDTLPRTLRDGLAAQRWTAIVLEPLDADAVVDMAAGLLGAEPSVPEAAALIARSQGHPRTVAELVDVATASGSDLAGPLATARASAEWARIAPQLDALELATMEQLAVAGRLPAECLDGATVTRLRQRGLVDLDADAHITSPPLADAALAALSAELVAIRACEAAEAIEAVLGPTPESAALCARGGRSLPTERGVAAASALHARGDDATALAVLDSTQDATSVEAVVLRASILSALEHLDEAAALLSDAEPDDPSTAFACVREIGLLHAVRRGDPATAVTEVESRLAAVTDPTHRAVIEGELVKWRLMAGVPGTSPEGLTAEAGADLQVNMALIQAMVASLDGPPSLAREIVAGGRAALAGATRPARHADELLALSEFLAECFDGHVDDAEAHAAERRRAALEAGDSAVGLWEFASAELALHAGRYDAAEAFGRRAVTHLAWRDFTGLRPTALALYGAVAARHGHAHVAARAHGQLPDGAEADVKVALHVARIRAEQRLRARDVSEAVRVLQAAATRAAHESHRHLGVFAFDEAWMTSPSERHAQPVLELAEQSPLAARMSRRIEAFHSGDLDALVEAAEALSEVGLAGRGLHALELAAAQFDEQRMPHEARKLRARSRAAQSFAQTSSWPLGAEEEALTAREREIASLAAARVRSREIATRLGVSVRTVDNHLGKVFRKLGIQSRDELADALAQADASSARD